MKSYSRRDQLSFDYCLKKNDLMLSYLIGSRDSNDYSEFENHQYNYYLDKRQKAFNQSPVAKKISIKLIGLMRKIKRGL